MYCIDMIIVLEVFKMLFFDKDLNKNITRSKALNYKTLVIEDGVEPGDQTDIKFMENTINLVKSDREKPSFEEVYGEGGSSNGKEEPDFLFVVKEFGVFKEIPNEVQLIFCDEYMLVDLIKGAIIIELDGKPLLVTRGDVKVPYYSMDNVVYLNPVDLGGFVSNWHKDGCKAKYTQDYLYSAIVRGTIVNNAGDYPARNLTIGKMKNPDGTYANPIDISGGKIAFIAEREADAQRSRAVKSALRTAVSPVTHVVDDSLADFGDVDDDEEDYEGYDDFDYDDEDFD